MSESLNHHTGFQFLIAWSAASNNLVASISAWWSSPFLPRVDTKQERTRLPAAFPEIAIADLVKG
jgi:hypothetical protein